MILLLAAMVSAAAPIQAPICADSARVVSDSGRAAGAGDPGRATGRATGAGVPGAPAGLPWVALVEHLGCERTRLADEIARGHARLKARAEAEAPALLPRIQAEPPKPKPTGYQLLPELTADAAPAAVRLTESRFALAALQTATAAERRAAERFSARAMQDTTALEPLVRELERLRARLRYVESSVSYHRFWQNSADDSRAFFDGRNRLVARAAQLREMERARADSTAVTAFRRSLADDLAPFAKTAGLAWREDSSGQKVLPITVVTDITDSAFVAAFLAAVEREWNQSEAAKAARFRIALTMTRIPPEQLYPDGVPATGTAIVEADHVGRFPKGALVLTTGGRSTHAWVGKYIQLATAAIGPRVLAHEFGHLLGFPDGYLRGTEGAGTDPHGFVIVEWTGILDDIMGAPGSGRVSAAMIARLVAAYPSGER